MCIAHVRDCNAQKRMFGTSREKFFRRLFSSGEIFVGAQSLDANALQLEVGLT